MERRDMHIDERIGTIENMLIYLIKHGAKHLYDGSLNDRQIIQEFTPPPRPRPTDLDDVEKSARFQKIVKAIHAQDHLSHDKKMELIEINEKAIYES